ncbi:PTS transporter subunit IIC [Haploplasma axanthum]|uniref:Predicted membrane protein, putative toxin regulator n=1 Tax=Haploplasma axanthum TaxID=29552 RepID=A0A449BF66_HAPAX|nr:PTS sugar transporter subunit IIC [Haploplasma axanthum]VEU81065.1 Predicted membrane protein, putative toxin regulator [Haploplasma axanthum]
MKTFIIKTLNGMAYGLFATLIIGVIFQQIGMLLKVSFLSQDLYNLLTRLMGIGIGLGIAVSLKKEGLSLVVMAIVGSISSTFALSINPLSINTTIPPSNPLTVYFVCIFTLVIAEKILRRKTAIDIMLIPFVYVCISLILTLVLSYPLNTVNYYISKFVNAATNFSPFIMSIIIAVSMGIILTSPVSSAAIAFSISLTGIAAGAAVVGTCIQMVGIAIQSKRDNNLGKVITIGIGTSMLQFKNIIKKPILWLPTALSSMIIAPIAVSLGFESNTAGAGMGTAGLVGPLQSLFYMNYSTKSFISIIIIIVIGGLLVYIFDKIMYKKGIIHLGDFYLDDNL